MMILRLALIVGLLISVPALFSGCGQGDGGEFRAYSPPPDAEAGSGLPESATAVLPADQGTPAVPGDAGTSATVDGGQTGTTNTSVATPDSVASTTTDGAPASPVIGAALPAAGPREVKLLVPEKTFQTVGPDGAIRVVYDDLDLLKVLNMEPVTIDAPDQFPQWLSDLEGKRIRLRGYMRPDVASEGLTGFILARDTQSCCFGPNTRAYDIIPTRLRDGVTTDYIELKPFDVVGVFHIEASEIRSRTGELKVEFLYNIDDAVIIRL